MSDYFAATRLRSLLALAFLLLPVACGDGPAVPTALPTSIPAATVAPATPTVGATATTVSEATATVALPPTLPATLEPTPPPSATLAPVETATAMAAPPTITPLPTEPPAATEKPAATPPPAATEKPAATPPPAASPTAAPVSGLGEIVFLLDGELTMVNPDGSGLRRLGLQGDLSTPHWLPNRTAIIYVQGKGGAADLWLVGRAGGAPLRLTNTPGVRETDPRPSPDGATIAYTRTADTNRDGVWDGRDGSEVWLVDAGGKNPRRLADGMDAAWAPDGKRLAFVSTGKRDAVNPYGENNTLDMINAQGQNRWSPVKIAQVPQDTSLLDPQAQFNAGTFFLRYPQWSPDNKGVAFVAQGHSGLIVTASDKGAAVTLRDFSYEGGYDRVFWSPDGRQLAYEVSPPSGIYQVAVLDLSAKKRVVFGSPQSGLSATGPTWSPDSRRLAFVQGGESSDPEAPPAGALVVARAGVSTDVQVIVPRGATMADWR